MRYSIIALAVAAGLAASPAFAVNLITNGDFTDLTNGLGQITTSSAKGVSTNITSAVGWQTAGYNSVIAVADQKVQTQYGAHNLWLWDQADGGANGWNGLAPVGNILALNGDYGTSAVTQTVSNLITGEKYVLKFDYAFAQQQGNNGATIQDLTVSVGSTSMTTAQYDLPNHGFSGWNNGELTFTATGSSEVLSFLAYGNLSVPPFSLVSDVSLSAAVPEPSTWALILCGFVGLAFAGRRAARRKAVAA